MRKKIRGGEKRKRNIHARAKSCRKTRRGKKKTEKQNMILEPKIMKRNHVITIIILTL